MGPWPPSHKAALSISETFNYCGADITKLIAKLYLFAVRDTASIGYGYKDCAGAAQCERRLG